MESGIIKKHEYAPYDLPSGAKVYTDNLQEAVSCAACGKRIIAGDSYTSLEIHTNMGFGYMVCTDCYNGEIERKRNSYENPRKTED